MRFYVTKGAVSIFFLLFACDANAYRSPWAINKHDIHLTGKAISALKHNNMRLYDYYIRKVHDTEIKSFAQWLHYSMQCSTRNDCQIVSDFPIIDKKKAYTLLGLELLESNTTSHKKEQASYEAINDLLWDKKPNSAIKKLRYHNTSKEKEVLLEARIALQKNLKNVKLKMQKVSKSMKDDPGLIYDQILWNIKNNNYQDSFNPLIKMQNQINKKYKKNWWYLRKRYARDVLYGGFKDYHKHAYKAITMDNDIDNIQDVAEKEWLAGWIALVFLLDNELAYNHFITLYKITSTPNSKSRAAYWAGKATANNETKLYWYKLSAIYKTTFYSQLALLELDENSQLMLNNDSSKYSYNPNYVANNRDAKKMYIASLLNENKLSNFFIQDAIKKTKNPHEIYSITSLALHSGNPSVAIKTAQSLEKQYGTYLPTMLYPIPYNNIYNVQIDPTLCLAIIRQESRFDSAALSPVGAHGLMQLMPKTAQSTAIEIGHEYNKNNLINPHYNITLGSSHMQNRLKYYDGSVILALASYNAGSHNVDKWVKQIGDPRNASSIDEAINWIESIPFAETRNYVQYIMSNIQVYKNLMYDNYKIKHLESDLLSRSRYTT